MRPFFSPLNFSTLASIKTPATPSLSGSLSQEKRISSGSLSLTQNFREKRYSEDMELEDAIHTAILTLKEGFDGQISAENIEIGVVGADRKFNILTASEIADYLEEVE